MKKITNTIFILISIFIFSISYWFDWKISVDSENIDINNPISLNISIDSTWSTNLNIKEIKWIENFDILSKTSSNNISIINWETKNNYSQSFVLQAKKDWEFVIGPAQIEENWKIISTNTVKIKVSWEKIKMLSPNINNINWFDNNLDKTFDSFFENAVPNLQNQEVKEFNNSRYSNNFEKKDKNRNYILYILWLIISFLIIIIIYISRKSFEKIKELENKISKTKIQEENKEISYPEIDDKDFSEKIEEILKIKIETFLDTKIENKTYTEILWNYDFQDKEPILENIIILINKLKYSKTDVNKEELITLIKLF